MKRTSTLAAIIILLVGVFYFSTIREGQPWGGDFGQYIHHAKNIVEGKDYRDIDYIYNPFYPSLGPRTYPPIFPLLLSPIYRWFGMNLTAMKVEVVLFFVAALFMIYLVFRDELPSPYVITIVAVIGFNPYLWLFKDEILSDIPFLFFVFLSLLVMKSARQASGWCGSQLLCGILVGVSIYIAYGTRSIGVLLLPAFLLAEVIQNRRLSQVAVVAILAFGLLAALQNAFLHSDSSYLDQLAQDPSLFIYDVFLSLEARARALMVLWNDGYSTASTGALIAIIGFLATVGYVARVRNTRTILEIFPLFYGLSSFLFPGVRVAYLIPLVPFFLFHAFIGIQQFKDFRGVDLERSLTIALVVIIFLSYVARYTTLEFGPIHWGVAKDTTVELFDYVRTETLEEDVFIFCKPRVLTLYTGRPASVYHRPEDDVELFGYFKQINAKYVVVGPPGYDRLVMRRERTTFSMEEFVASHGDRFEKKFDNADFAMYRIIYLDEEPLGIGDHIDLGDTYRARGFLEDARISHEKALRLDYCALATVEVKR